MLSSISLFLLLALRVAGDSITPTNAPLPSENGQLFMEFPSMKFEVAPLTPGAGMGQQGNVFSVSCSKTVSLLTLYTNLILDN